MTSWELQKMNRMMNDVRRVKCIKQQYKAWSDEIAEPEVDDGSEDGVIVAEQYPSNISHPDGMYGF